MEVEAQLPGSRVLQPAGLVDLHSFTGRIPARCPHKGQRSTRGTSLADAPRCCSQPGPDRPENERLTVQARRGWTGDPDLHRARRLRHRDRRRLCSAGYARRHTSARVFAPGSSAITFIGKFGLGPQAIGAMALGSEATDRPGRTPWDGVVSLLKSRSGMLSASSTALITGWR